MTTRAALPRRVRASRGFTLIELVVVIAILSVLSGLVIGLRATPFGASAQTVSSRLSSVMGLAKMRAIATQRYIRVEVQAQTATIWQSTQTGMVTPTAWQFYQQVTIPNGVSVWNGSTTVYATAGSSVTQNTALDVTFDFRPDSSSTGGTLFVSDTANAHPYRVLVYQATGSAYARALW